MMSREHIKNDLLERRISAIIRTENQKVADQAMQAAVDGRFRIFSFYALLLKIKMSGMIFPVCVSWPVQLMPLSSKTDSLRD